MADLLFTNNASASLAASINTVDTTVQVAAGFGALFPNPGTDQFFHIAVEDDNGDIEIMRCTARSTDNLTVVRAQDGTSARSFTSGAARVELRLVAASMQEFLQLSGGTMTGDLNLDENEIQDAVLTGSSTSIQGGEIAGVPIRGASGETGNQLVVPSNGTDTPTVGGTPLVLNTDDIVALLDTAGVIIFDSATTGVRIPDNAYLRIEGSASDYVAFSHDDTDFNIAGNNTTDLNVSGFTDVVFDSVNLNMSDNSIERAEFVDFGVTEQSVTATTTTELDYESGAYVNLDLSADITVLTLSNPPANGAVGSFRIKITSTGDRSITWPASVNWPDGLEPDLTEDGVDFVDLWTDDAGTTWYGAYALNMS